MAAAVKYYTNLCYTDMEIGREKEKGGLILKKGRGNAMCLICSANCPNILSGIQNFVASGYWLYTHFTWGADFKTV